MSLHELKLLLDDVPDTLEIVLRGPRHEPAGASTRRPGATPHDDAAAALRTWRAWPGDAAYAAYRAAQDREDAAQDALAQTHTSRSSVS